MEAPDDSKLFESAVSEPVLTCTECSSTFFYQIERRITGVIVNKGEIVVQQPLDTKTTTYFVCRHCGCIVPQEGLAAFKYQTHLPEPMHN